MIKTRLLTDGDPLANILAGAEKMYKAVSVTMGPRGHNVIFRKLGRKVAITHDGVTVARAVKLNDPAEDVGADLLREAASKLDATTGDGTTTVTVLAYHILKNAAELIEQGENPMTLKLALDGLSDDIVTTIKNQVDTDVTEKKLAQVATVAAGDKEIGEKVGEAIFAAGKDTPVIIGFSDSAETHIDVIDGFKIASGPASPYLSGGVRDELENVRVAVVDAKLRDKNDVLPILKVLATVPPEERKVLLVCAEIAGDALSIMVLNKLKGFGGVMVARVPQNILGVTEYLTDVAMATGAKVLSRNTGNTISEPSLEDFGFAGRVITEPTETVIVRGQPIKEDLDNHKDELKKMAKAKDAKSRKFAEDRLQTLEQKVVSIFVGGQSETEAEEKHYRYEDAVGASRAALRGGVLPGGGTVLYCIGGALDNAILGAALAEPLSQVLSNAGVEIPDGIKPGYGIDVMNPDDGVVDLAARGILDPAESEIECVKTAISVAGLLMTAGAMVVDEEPDEAKLADSTDPSRPA